MKRITTDGTYSVGQRVRIRKGSGVRYGTLNLISGRQQMASADGIEGVLVEYQPIDQKFGGSRWVMKTNEGDRFHLTANELEQA